MLPAWLNPALAWFILGVVLLVVELVSTGVLAIFFAFGAWVAALTVWIGLTKQFSSSLLVFLVFSVLSLIFLRKRLTPVVRGRLDAAGDTDRALDDFIGKRAVALEAIDSAKNVGRIEFRGSVWDARSDTPIEKGTTVEIVGRDNLTLHVKPVKE